MKTWKVRKLVTEKLLGTVVAPGPSEACDVAWAQGYRGFVVEPHGEAEPSVDDLINLAAQDATNQVSSMFSHLSAESKPRGRKKAWHPTDGISSTSEPTTQSTHD